MKSVVLLRITLTLVVAMGVSSTQLFSQGQRQGGGQGGGGQGGGGQGQRGGIPSFEGKSKEEIAKWFNDTVIKNVTEMADVVEMRDDQQEAFVKVQAKHESEALKLQLQGRQAGRDRDKRMAIMGNMQKLGKETEKAMKDILDKDQMKAYSKKMKERQPQQGQRGGGGGGGGGQRGGGGGGGGGDN